MQKLSRREALRGTGVAALAAAAMMPLVVGGAVADAGTDPLFNVLNRFKAELATFDAYTLLSEGVSLRVQHDRPRVQGAHMVRQAMRRIGRALLSAR